MKRREIKKRRNGQYRKLVPRISSLQADRTFQKLKGFRPVGYHFDDWIIYPIRRLPTKTIIETV